MQLIRTLPTHPNRPTAVAIGNFDGMHRGHRAVIEAMRRVAAANQYVPAILTFEPHPRRFFAKAAAPFRLEPVRAKLSHFAAAGVERVYMPRFNTAFASLTPEQFLQEILHKALGARAVITGADFAFGRQRAGDVGTLQRWGEATGANIIAVPPVIAEDGCICSSSAIRHCLDAGDMRGAAALLGRGYQITGRVVHGDGRGRTIGYPTANLALMPGLKLPAYGVYAVRARVGGACYNGVANLGVRPTVHRQGLPTFEVHLFDVAQDVYGMRMEVTLIARVRAEQKFENVAALIAQIAQDADTAKTLLEHEHA